MKSTTHFVTFKGERRRVKLAQGGWFTVKVSGWSPVGDHYRRYRAPNYWHVTTYRARTLWQLQRLINGLSTGAHP